MLDKNIKDKAFKYCRNKKHIRLDIGYFDEENESIETFYQNERCTDADIGLYEIGSITKTFIASKVASLLKEGRLSIEDNISKYITELPRDRTYPTIRKLLTHTSGYGGYPKSEVWDTITGQIRSKNPFMEISDKKMVSYIQEKRLRDKNYSWFYSNFGIGVVGLVISCIDKDTLGNIMNKYIKEELQLHNTFWVTKKEDYSSKIVPGYDNKNIERPNWNWEDAAINGAGCIISSVGDLINFAKQNVYDHYGYLKKTQVPLARRIDGAKVGMVWNMDNKFIWHNGSTGCYTSVLKIDPVQKRGVVLLSNYHSKILGCTPLNKIGNRILEKPSK